MSERSSEDFDPFDYVTLAEAQRHCSTHELAQWLQSSKIKAIGRYAPDYSARLDQSDLECIPDGYIARADIDFATSRIIARPNSSNADDEPPEWSMYYAVLLSELDLNRARSVRPLKTDDTPLLRGRPELYNWDMVRQWLGMQELDGLSLRKVALLIEENWEDIFPGINCPSESALRRFVTKEK